MTFQASLHMNFPLATPPLPIYTFIYHFVHIVRCLLAFVVLSRPDTSHLQGGPPLPLSIQLFAPWDSQSSFHLHTTSPSLLSFGLVMVYSSPSFTQFEQLDAVCWVFQSWTVYLRKKEMSAPSVCKFLKFFPHSWKCDTYLSVIDLIPHTDAVPVIIRSGTRVGLTSRRGLGDGELAADPRPSVGAEGG